MTNTPQAQVTEEMVERAIKATAPIQARRIHWVVEHQIFSDDDALPDDVSRKAEMRAALESALSAPPARQDNDAIADIAAERRRQIEQEGWSLKHDDDGAMADAAACYAVVGVTRPGFQRPPMTVMLDGYWPWAMNWWKPKERRRNLVKAAALIIAEIERLDRAAQALARVRGEKEE